MAKKDKKKKDKPSSGQSDPLESVRSAVERTLKATGEGTAGAQKHARELVDEVAHAANRFREAMGELKVLDDLKKEVAGLRQRVTALEGKATTSSAGPRRTATRSTAAKRTAAKPAASRSRSTAAKKPAASRSRSTAAKKPAAKSTGTATRSRRTAAKKPAATRSTRTGSTGSSGSSSSS
jgi:hypothetical protein